MALDGIFLYSIIEELKNTILNGRVEKVNQPEKDEIILSIKNEKNSYKLCLSASSVYPKINLSSISKPNPIQAPMFCMVLRKHLNNSRIVDIRQLDTDRVLFIDFESHDDLGFNSIYSLIVEIMGRHSNITLVRQRDNIIMDSIKHITPEINSVRCLYPGIEYIYPPKSNKLNPLNYNYAEFLKFVITNELNVDKNFFSKVFTGISTQFSKEIYYRIKTLNILYTNENLEEINNFSKNIFHDIEDNKFYFANYSNNGTLSDFYCFDLSNLENVTKNIYSSPSKLVEEYYYEKDKSDRLNSKSSVLQKLVNINLDRCSKKIQLLNDTLKECEDKETYRIYGELLTSNIYNIKPGDKEVTVQNYYTEECRLITIRLNENKSPSENIQNYFKKYTKLKKSEEAAKHQIGNAKEEFTYLQSVLTNLKNAEDYESIEEIKNELIETGYIKFHKSKHKKSKTSKPLHFISSDGIHIYVGKNNIQNDYLTLKFADKRDVWMHTKDIPGSHVIIKNFGEISDKTLEEAALLAGYYSKGKESSKVAIDYTEVKNVKKPSGAKPGMVIYYTNRTIYVDPKKPEIKQVN